MHRFTARALSAIALAVLPAISIARAYVIVDLGIDSDARAINGRNEIAGSYQSMAAIWSKGSWRGYTFRKTSTGDALDIDARGDMVGLEAASHNTSVPTYFARKNSSGTAIKMRFDNGAVDRMGISSDGKTIVGTHEGVCFEWKPRWHHAKDLQPQQDYDSCSAKDVNSAGQAVGELVVFNQSDAAFIYQDGVFTFVDQTTGGELTRLQVINDAGHAAGWRSGSGTDTGATYWDGTTLTLLPQDDGLAMLYAGGINEIDDIVGVGTNAAGSTILLYSGGLMIDVPPLIENAEGWLFGGANVTGINDAGFIVGNAWFDGSMHGFMLVPQ